MFSAGVDAPSAYKHIKQKGRSKRPFYICRGGLAKREPHLPSMFQFGTHLISHILQQLQNSLALLWCQRRPMVKHFALVISKRYRLAAFVKKL